MFIFLSGFQSDISYYNCLFLVRSSWSSNPHFRGSYSFRSMETERMGVSAAQLSEPVANSNGISVCVIFTSCLFISPLFNSDYIKLGYTATNDRLIVAELIGKDTVFGRPKLVRNILPPSSGLTFPSAGWCQHLKEIYCPSFMVL